MICISKNSYSARPLALFADPYSPRRTPSGRSAGISQKSSACSPCGLDTLSGAIRCAKSASSIAATSPSSHGLCPPRVRRLEPDPGILLLEQRLAHARPVVYAYGLHLADAEPVAVPEHHHVPLHHVDGLVRPGAVTGRGDGRATRGAHRATDISLRARRGGEVATGGARTGGDASADERSRHRTARGRLGIR